MSLSTEQQFWVDQLRSTISMRTTAASGSSYQLSAKLGDAELWEDFRLGLNMFNTTPPIVTAYTSKDLYDASQTATNNGQDPLSPTTETSTSVYMSCVMMCAMFFVGLRLQWFEAGKHFRYNDNGISIERVKQGDYQNVVASNILQYISTVLPNIRKTLGFQRIHIRGQFSGMVSFPRSLTRGSRGTRLGVG